ncbi:MAG: type II secretion system protein [Planctomycetes bacterium]|nr:type II secretion system protein [Planctomycetota bacterium]
MRCPRMAMTLIEILVSVMIFSVVGLAMMAILLTSTELFRRGEYGRAATDSSISILAAIEDDLDRLVPAANGGFVAATIQDDSGNCMLAMKIESRDKSLITKDGVGRRLAVFWRVNVSDPKHPVLERGQRWAKDSDGDPDNDAETDGDNVSWTPTGIGCMHFSVWFSGDADAARLSPSDWTTDAAGDDIWPQDGGSAAYASIQPVPGTPYDFIAPHPATGAFPSAMRIVLVLSGDSRYAPKGTVVSDTRTAIRVAGLGGASTLRGSVAQVGDEWIAYDGFADGEFQVPATGRQHFRSIFAGAHPRGAAVKLGEMYSLVRSLP